MTTLADLVDHCAALPTRAVVGISGLAGAGKSTLTRHLLRELPTAVRLRVDDFLDPTRSHRRSQDWDGVERTRIRQEVLDPFRAGRTAIDYRPYDWGRRRLGQPRELPAGGPLLVEGIGILHPELDDAFDLTIWIEADPTAALERGMRRDTDRNSRHDELWQQVWKLNDADFVRGFAPHRRADIVIDDAELRAIAGSSPD